MLNFKPMLAANADNDKLKFPLLASYKLDGVRAIVREGIVFSRSNKPIPNKHIQEMFKHLEYFDGELIVGNPTSPSCYRDTISEVMSHDKTNGATFFAFDYIEHLTLPFHERITKLKDSENCQVLSQRLITNLDSLLTFEETAVLSGYEGLILRDANAPYKCGRSTVSSGQLLKLKRFVDDEAVVIGFEERMHNANEATTNELGRTARSSHKANLVPMGTLGALIVKFGDIEFSIGTGMNDEERMEIWSNRKHYLGKLVKFKYFQVGMKDAPRHPVFLGIREEIDL